MAETPTPTLRQKYDYSSYSNEQALFQALPMGDTWSDAGLKECFMYLWYSKHLRVPSQWLATMKRFALELKDAPWF